MGQVVMNAFAKLGQDVLAVYALNVITLMTEDAQFTSLTPQIALLKDCYDAYMPALSNNVNGGRIATAEKDKCKETLINELRSLGNMVDYLAQGEKNIIRTAGFTPRKSATSYTALVAPSVQKYIVDGPSSTVTIQLSKVAGVTQFAISKRIIVEGEDTPWINDDYATARRFKLSDLVVGKTYKFRICAIGKGGLVSPWSRVLEVFVA